MIDLAAEKVRRWNAVLYAARGLPVPRPGVWLVAALCPDCRPPDRYCSAHFIKPRRW